MGINGSKSDRFSVKFTPRNNHKNERTHLGSIEYPGLLHYFWVSRDERLRQLRQKRRKRCEETHFYWSLMCGGLIGIGLEWRWRNFAMHRLQQEGLSRTLTVRSHPMGRTCSCCSVRRTSERGVFYALASQRAKRYVPTGAIVTYAVLPVATG